MSSDRRGGKADMQRDCIFCQIVSGAQEAEFLYRDPSMVVFKDIHPHAPVHLLIVPQRHIRSINDVTEEDRDVVAEMIFRGKEAAREVGIDQSGYKLLFNVERGGGQVIFHLHLHLLGGW
jgi:histidine triad (HIT) family protein